MIYEFVKGATRKLGRAPTTREIEEYALEVLPMCADHVQDHIVLLERKGLVRRRFDPERKAFVWELVPPIRTAQQLAEEFPELYLESMYYHAVSERLAGKPLPMEPVIKVLYEISKGERKRIPVSVIHRVLARALEKGAQSPEEVLTILKEEMERGQ